jgi:hypothetical protein
MDVTAADLTSLLLRVAARRPHVLVVAVPGAVAVRLALEAALARRGWPTAIGPADADVLAVAGSPGPELAAVVAQVWRQIPAPRARVDVREPADVDGQLDGAAAVLSDRDQQRSAPPDLAADPVDAGDRAGRGPHPHGEPADHSEHGEQAGHGGGHHGHHGHGGGMEMPGGLPMADLGEDRDGLTLDRLHVPLGPVLPDWPAGLVVRVTLQGDVIQEAAAEVLDPATGDQPAGRSEGATARELDGLARFLGVAGWPDAAARARALRDALLAGAASEQIDEPLAALVRRVRRSRTLRWSIRRIPAGATDVLALLEARLSAIETRAGDVPAARQPAVDELASLLVGAELAAARLIIAAVAPDTDRAPAHEEARRG